MKNLLITAIGGYCLTLLVLFAIAMGWNHYLVVSEGIDVWAEGIVAHPSGEAVYISGEECVVNAGQNLVTTSWCYEQYQQDTYRLNITIGPTETNILGYGTVVPMEMK